MKILCFVAGIGLLVAGFVVPATRTGAREQPPGMPRGDEQVLPGSGIYTNGHNVLNLGSCRLADWYQTAALFAGEPVSPMANGMSFANVIVRCVPSADMPNFTFTNSMPNFITSMPNLMMEPLGAYQLRAEGRLPTPGATPPPIVQAHLAKLLTGGLDLDTWFGQYLTTVCEGSRCRSYFVRRLLSYEAADKDTLQEETIVTEPLGCRFTPACQRALVPTTQQQAHPLRLPLLLGGAGLLIVGVVLLARGRGGGSNLTL